MLSEPTLFNLIAVMLCYGVDSQISKICYFGGLAFGGEMGIPRLIASLANLILSDVDIVCGSCCYNYVICRLSFNFTSLLRASFDKIGLNCNLRLSPTLPLLFYMLGVDTGGHSDDRSVKRLAVGGCESAPSFCLILNVDFMRVYLNASGKCFISVD